MDLREARTFANTIRHPWELARLKIVEEQLATITGKGKGLLILDIGSGDLFVVETLSKKFPDCRFIAVDTEFSREFLNENSVRLRGSNLEIFSSLDDLTKNEIPPADVITLLDVVEHIEDDKGFLRSLIQNKFAGENTKVLITVPAYQSLFCSHDRFLLHFRRHNNRGLTQRLKESGYVKEYAGYFFFLLLFPRILTVLKEKVIRPRGEIKTGLSSWNGGKFLTNFIRFILLADYRTGRFFHRLGIRIPGLSLYCVCKPGA